MDKRWSFVPILVAAAVLPVTAADSAGSAKQVRHTTGFIESLAIDGPLVGYDAHGDNPHGPRCNRVYAWNLNTQRVTRVSGRGTCEADDSSTGSGVAELAVAGSRLAWIVNIGGLSESLDRLYTASMPAPRERKLAAVGRFGDVDCVLAGRWLGGLVGRGNVLAYNLWATVAANPGEEGSCEMKTTSAALRRIGSGGTSLLRGNLDTLVAEDADGGRIAVLHDDGTVELFSSSGAPLGTIGIESAKEIALAGDRLLVLTKTRRIQVYSVKTGRPGAAYDVPRVAENLDAAGGTAVYTSGTKLHVLRLATGRDSVAATAPRQIVDVAVSNRAIAYAYNVYKRGRTSYRDIGNVVVMARS